MSQPLRVLSFGAGVQSTAILYMMVQGDLPKVDACVFADTGWEPKEVYEHLAFCEKLATDNGIPFYRCSAGNIYEDSLKSAVRAVQGKEDNNFKGAARAVSMPMYVLNVVGTEQKIGAIRRQCTREYKVEPVNEFIRRELLRLRKYQTAATGAVEVWIGISTNEVQRARLSTDRWRTNHFPLLELRKSRHDCVLYGDKFGYPRAPRSACKGCPFKSNEEWRRLRDESPEEFREAVEFDRIMRHKAGVDGELYLHRSCVPLDQVDLSTPEERGQGNLFDQECTGMCGL